MTTYKCKYCNYNAKNKKDNYNNHLKTKKHFENELKYFEERNICGFCKRDLKNKSTYSRHNCKAKHSSKIIAETVTASQIINGDVNGDNNTFIVFPENYKGDLFKHIQQLLSPNVLPMQHKESKNYFNLQILTILESEIDMILRDIEKCKNTFTKDEVIKLSKNIEVDTELKNKFDMLKMKLKNLDEYLLKSYPNYENVTIGGIQFKGLFPYYNKIYVVHRLFPEYVKITDFDKNKYRELFDKDNIKINNDKVIKCFIHYLISESIRRTFISGPNKFKCMLKEDADLYFKTDKEKLTKEKKLQKLTKDVINSLINNFDTINSRICDIGYNDYEFDFSYKEVYKILEDCLDL